jgi:hypothetical protein
MTAPKLHVIPSSPVERLAARQAEARAEAARIALGVLSLASEAAEQLRELKAIRDALPASVGHDAPILADQMSQAIARMIASLKNGGRVR